MPRRRTVRGIPQDLATICRDVGSLLLMESGLMALSVVVALAAREWYPALAFLLAAGVTAVVGGSARRYCREAPDPVMKHGMVIAASGWLFTALFGSLPFLLAAYLTPLSAMAGYVPAGAGWEAVSIYGATSKSSLVYFRDPIHAVFESMSGWTGSG